MNGALFEAGSGQTRLSPPMSDWSAQRPTAAELAHRSKLTSCAITGCEQMQQISYFIESLDHFISDSKERWADLDPQRSCRFKIKYEGEFSGLLDRKIRRFISVKNAVHDDR
jgi:hypothetical protein